MNKKISIVIVTKNNLLEKSFSLAYVLKSIEFQHYKNHEVILVNDGGTDKTIQNISDMFKHIKVVTPGKLKGNIGGLRNVGAKHSTGDVILFVDDDTVFTDIDVLEKISILTDKYDFLCGAHRYWTSIYWYKNICLDQTISSTIRTLLEISTLPCGIDRKIGFRDLNEYTFIGNFGAIRKEAFDLTGGFNESFAGWGLEDTEYIMRLCTGNLKYKILSEEGISVIHLTHVAENFSNYIDNLRKFNDIEMLQGKLFHINHFFGVYEADGYELFTDIR